MNKDITIKDLGVAFFNKAFTDSIVGSPFWTTIIEPHKLAFVLVTKKGGLKIPFTSIFNEDVNVEEIKENAYNNVIATLLEQEYKYNTLAGTIVQEYNPIENYNRSDEYDETTHGDTETSGKTTLTNGKRESNSTLVKGEQEDVNTSIFGEKGETKTINKGEQADTNTTTYGEEKEEKTTEYGESNESKTTEYGQESEETKKEHGQRDSNNTEINRFGVDHTFTTNTMDKVYSVVDIDLGSRHDVTEDDKGEIKRKDDTIYTKHTDKITNKSENDGFKNPFDFMEKENIPLSGYTKENGTTTTAYGAHTDTVNSTTYSTKDKTIFDLGIQKNKEITNTNKRTDTVDVKKDEKRDVKSNSTTEQEYTDTDTVTKEEHTDIEKTKIEAKTDTENITKQEHKDIVNSVFGAREDTEISVVDGYTDKVNTTSGTRTDTENNVQEESTDLTESNGKEESTGNKHYRLTSKGNIGVTTTQQMLEQERNVAMFSLMDVIIKDVVGSIALGFWY